MKLSSIDISTAPKHVIVYGPPKSGKTKLCFALAEFYNIHYVGFESGEHVGKQLPHSWQERIDIINIPDTRTNPCATQTMLRLIKNGRIRPCVEHGLDTCTTCSKNPDAGWNELDTKQLGPDDILVIDSLTQLTTSLLAHIGKGGGEDWKPEYDDWRKMGTLLDMILSEFQNAPYNVICISHENLVPVAHGIKGEEKVVPVAGTRNFSRNSAKYFDTVVYCEVKNGKHNFASKTTYANNILTGDRLGVDISQSDIGLLPIFKGEQNAPAAKVSNLTIKK